VTYEMTSCRVSVDDSVGLRCGAELAFLVDIVQHRRETGAEHLLADGAQDHLREDEPTDAGESCVFVREAGTGLVGLEPVGDLCHVAAIVGEP
jgi:hypothetical protein